jgi:regulator of nucleoside diphosphate kinase
MSDAPKPTARPRITLREGDAERISALALQNELASPGPAGMLLAEVARARIVPDGRAPADVVGMGSIVEFIDEARGRPRTVQLVYPAEADIAAGRISILTPIGAALIGLAEGQSILWPDRDGQRRALRIVRVDRAAAGA